MGFELTTFDDTLNLINYNAEYDNNASVKPVILKLPGGWLDLYRTQRMRMDQIPLSARGTVISDDGGLMEYVRSLLGYVGHYGVLRRRWAGSIGEQKINARMTGVKSKHVSRHKHEVIITFVLDSDHWDGYFVGLEVGNYNESWALGSGRLLGERMITGATSNNASTLKATNDGTVAVLDASVQVKAVGASVTSVRVYTDLDGVRLTDWRVAATIPAGSELLVHCGRRSVTIDGDPAWSGFEFNSGHSIVDWLAIPPGGIEVKFEVSTTSSSEQEVAVGGYHFAWQ